MKIAIAKERRPHERRVAATPDTIKRYLQWGFDVAVESGAGEAASISDAAYREAGATVGTTRAEVFAGADIVLKVQRPRTRTDGGEDGLSEIPEGAYLIALHNPYGDPVGVEDYAGRNIVAFAMEMVPRISRAQSMDVLSSQSNLTGYKAVIDAAANYGKAMPMLMTAAGRINPAKVFVMGAGVAGLQAIATARRLPSCPRQMCVLPRNRKSRALAPPSSWWKPMRAIPARRQVAMPRKCPTTTSAVRPNSSQITSRGRISSSQRR